MRYPSSCVTAPLFSLLIAGCITVPNSRVCSTAGRLADGMICAETNTPVTSELTLDQTIDFLEPQEKPARAGAICMSSKDWNEMKTALEQACRQLGGKCRYEGRKKN